MFMASLIKIEPVEGSRNKKEITVQFLGNGYNPFTLLLSRKQLEDLREVLGVSSDEGLQTKNVCAFVRKTNEGTVYGISDPLSRFTAVFKGEKSKILTDAEARKIG